MPEPQEPRSERGGELDGSAAWDEYADARPVARDLAHFEELYAHELVALWSALKLLARQSGGPHLFQFLPLERFVRLAWRTS
jgi:hypothetical protein